MNSAVVDSILVILVTILQLLPEVDHRTGVHLQWTGVVHLHPWAAVAVVPWVVLRAVPVHLHRKLMVSWVAPVHLHHKVVVPWVVEAEVGEENRLRLKNHLHLPIR